MEFTRSNAFLSRQDDTDTFRLWESAGTAHGDVYSLAGLWDKGDNALFARLLENSWALPGFIQCENIINGNPFHHMLTNAAYHSLDLWIRTGTPPSSAQRLETQGNPLQIVRDEHGNAMGGIRSPYVDIPIATYNGIGKGHLACQLFGSMHVFDRSKLESIYFDGASYVEAVEESTNRLIDQGFLLPADAELIVEAANLKAKDIQ